MLNILSVSDLWDYNEISKITNMTAEEKLLMKLQEAEEAVKDGTGWLSLDELKAAMEG